MSAPRAQLDIVFLGLSITSSWGNGHATTYRALTRGLAERGHRVTFLERDLLWYRDNRDLPNPPHVRTELYDSLEVLQDEHEDTVRDADLVVVGSYVPEGANVGEWVLRTARGCTAFYDIDTPVTLAQLRRGDCEYLTPSLIPRYDLYLSFTGGPMLRQLEEEFGSPRARALYCAVDESLYRPPSEPGDAWDLGYMGTYSADRQEALDRLLLTPARSAPTRRFAVAGPQYPTALRWPANVERLEHVAPREHRAFYGAQRFTLNITRADMVAAGWSPSVRLFEAAACGVPVISDEWKGLEEFFTPNQEIIVARSAGDVLRALCDMPERERHQLASRARARVLRDHTASRRAAELERLACELLARHSSLR